MQRLLHRFFILKAGMESFHFGDEITEKNWHTGYTVKKRKGCFAMLFNKETFENLVNNGEKPVLVEFQAPWCGYCRRLASAMETVEKQYESQLSIGFVDIDQEPELEEQEKIELIPTLVLYHKGKRLGTVVNPESKAKIDAFIRETLEK